MNDTFTTQQKPHNSKHLQTVNKHLQILKFPDITNKKKVLISHRHPSTGCVGFRHMHLSEGYSPYLHPFSCGRCKCSSTMRACVAPCQPWCSQEGEPAVRRHPGVPGHHPQGCTHALVGPCSLALSVHHCLGANSCVVFRQAWAGWWCQGVTSGSTKVDVHCCSVPALLSLSPHPSCCYRFSCLCPPFQADSFVSKVSAISWLLFNGLMMPSSLTWSVLGKHLLRQFWVLCSHPLHTPTLLCQQLCYTDYFGLCRGWTMWPVLKNTEKIIRWPHDSWNQSVRCTCFSFLPVVYSHTSIPGSAVKPTMQQAITIQWWA